MAQAASGRVALYGRTSVDQSDGRSVDDQLAELRRWARATGRTIAAEHRDDGVSASRYAKAKVRPGWSAIMELISTGAVAEVAVWELSRSTRDRSVWSGLVSACIASGVRLVVGGKVHDPADPDDGFLLDLQAALAVRESGVIGKRNQRNVDARAAAGRPHGSLPFGYKRSIDPETGKTVGRVPHPDQAPVVQEIVRRLLSRESADSIAADLNRRGVPTHLGRKWVGGNLVKMAARPTYAGLRVYRGNVLPDVKASWEPLISLDDHAHLAAMLSNPERDKFRNSTAVKHLGSGLFRCGREGCDGAMHVVVQSRGRVNRYCCRVCHKVSRNQPPVDELVERLMIARLSQPDVLDLLRNSDEDQAASEAALEVARLKVQLAEVRERVAAGSLGLDDLAYFKKRWEKQLADAERRATPQFLPPAVVEAAGPDAALRWAASGIGTRRAILAALATVTILPAGPGNRPFNPDLIKVEWASQAVS